MSDGNTTNHFVKPPPPGLYKDYGENAIYKIGQVVTLSWAQGLPNTVLTLIRDNEPGDRTSGPSRSIIEGISTNEYNWTVSYIGLDPRTQNVFYLALYNDDSGFNSHYFNITGDENGIPASAPSRASTVTFVSTAPTAAPSSSTPSPSTTVISTLLISTESSNSTSLKAGGFAGIAIGATLGAIIIAAVLGWLLWTIRKRKAAPENQAPRGAYPPAFAPVGEPQQLMSTPVAEMEGNHKPVRSHPDIPQPQTPG